MQNVRLDKWLWAARFYKTRPLAVEAINGGHVHVNGQRSKPAKEIVVGDEVKITKGSSVFEITVLALSDKRGPASQAQLLYEEHAASMAQRQQVREQHKLMAAANPRPTKRPDKRQRRKIIRFVNKNQTG